MEERRRYATIVSLHGLILVLARVKPTAKTTMIRYEVGSEVRRKYRPDEDQNVVSWASRSVQELFCFGNQPEIPLCVVVFEELFVGCVGLQMDVLDILAMWSVDGR